MIAPNRLIFLRCCSCRCRQYEETIAPPHVVFKHRRKDGLQQDQPLEKIIGVVEGTEITEKKENQLPTTAAGLSSLFQAYVYNNSNSFDHVPRPPVQADLSISISIDIDRYRYLLIYIYL
jgi:hypothetical protein